jgi:hypothetical protein
MPGAWHPHPWLGLSGHRGDDTTRSVFYMPRNHPLAMRVDLSIDLVLDIARQGGAVHTLHVVGKGASVTKLRGMAHRGILLGIRSLLPWFYRMSRVGSIARHHPYTTP